MSGLRSGRWRVEPSDDRGVTSMSGWTTWAGDPRGGRGLANEKGFALFIEARDLITCRIRRYNVRRV